MNFQTILMPKLILSNFCHKKSTHLDHSYLKHALESKIIINFKECFAYCHETLHDYLSCKKWLDFRICFIGSIKFQEYSPYK